MNETYYPAPLVHMSAYDVVRLADKQLYRAMPGTFPESVIVEHAPCSDRYWGLPRWMEGGTMQKLNPTSRRTQVLARFVKDLATLSKCEDRGVAAIITNADGTQIYSMGINGGPKGGPQCLCHMGEKYTCIHAEANALAKCISEDQDKVMICSLAPCVTCASLMANSGIRRVFYLEDYKDNKGAALLTSLGIACCKLELPGGE